MTTARVLVTGGAGFIGVNLARTLAPHGFDTRCFDDFSTGRREDAESAGYEDIVEGDVRDADALREAASGCSHVVHLAAQAGVPSSVADPVRDCTLNVQGTLNALLAARDVAAEGFVFASSNAPLGQITPPAHEGIVPRPTSPYGASKLAGEAYCSAFTASYGLPAVALRFANVYGPYSYHKGSVVASFCKAAAAGEPLVVYGDGRQTRDLVHVDDICAGIAAAVAGGRSAETGTPGTPDGATDGAAARAGAVLHLGSGVETEVATVAQMVAERFGGHVRVEHRPPRVGDVRRSACDLSTARAVLGYDPRIELADGLDETVAWFTGAPAGATG